MKQFFLLSILLTIAVNLFAQTPQTLNYQGVARNAAGQAYANAAIAVRLKIKITPNGAIPLYSETRSVTTNAFGLFNVTINSAGALTKTGDFTTIDWATGTKYLETEIDPAGGANFVSLGATQMQSVPFALQSAKAADLEFPRADYFNNSGTTVWHLENNGTTTPLHIKNAGTGGALLTTAVTGSAITAITNTNLASRGAIDGSNTGIDGFGVRGTASHANSVGVEAVNGTGLALNVNGRLKIAGGNTSPGAGKVLTSDASGNATWQMPTPPAVNKVGFSVRGVALGGLQTVPNNQWYKLHCQYKEYDPGNDYTLYNQGTVNNPSSTFTTPVSGLYSFSAAATFSGCCMVWELHRGFIRLMMKRNGIVYTLLTNNTEDYPSSVKKDIYAQLNTNVYLQVGDQVWVEVLGKTSTGQNPTLQHSIGGEAELNKPYHFFSGYLIFSN